VSKLPRFKLIFEEEAGEFILTQSRRRQRRLIDIYYIIASDPFAVPDYILPDAAGRYVSVVLTEGYLIGYWVDFPAKLVVIAEIQELKNRKGANASSQRPRAAVADAKRWPRKLKLDRSPESRQPPDMRRKVRSFNVVIERDRDGFYVASVPELRGCHTQAKSLDVLLKRVREVVDLCLEVDSNAVDSPEFIGVQRISV